MAALRQRGGDGGIFAAAALWQQLCSSMVVAATVLQQRRCGGGGSFAAAALRQRGGGSGVAYLEYFGTYLGYLPTNLMSHHSDTFPANPSWIPDIPHHRLLQN